MVGRSHTRYTKPSNSYIYTGVIIINQSRITHHASSNHVYSARAVEPHETRIRARHTPIMDDHHARTPISICAPRNIFVCRRRRRRGIADASHSKGIDSPMCVCVVTISHVHDVHEIWRR